MKKITYVTIALAAIFLSCKKSEADAVIPATNNNGGDTTIYSSTTVIVPRGPITRSDLYEENGFISGTIVSKLSDGSYFQRTFNHELDLEMPTFYLNADGRYVIHFSKGDKSGSLAANDKKTEMTFVLKLANNAAHSLEKFNTSIYVDSTATTITKFNVEQTIASNTILTLSNVNFNPENGTFAADYTMNFKSADYTSSGQNATIIGKIQTTLTNVRYRTGS